MESTHLQRCLAETAASSPSSLSLASMRVPIRVVVCRLCAEKKKGPRPSDCSFSFTPASPFRCHGHRQLLRCLAYRISQLQPPPKAEPEVEPKPVPNGPGFSMDYIYACPCLPYTFGLHICIYILGVLVNQVVYKEVYPLVVSPPADMAAETLQTRWG